MAPDAAFAWSAQQFAQNHQHPVEVVDLEESWGRTSLPDIANET